LGSNTPQRNVISLQTLIAENVNVGYQLVSL